MEEQDQFQPIWEEVKMIEATVKRLEKRDDVPQIELDVLLDHVRKLYEESLELKNIENNASRRTSEHPVKEDEAGEQDTESEEIAPSSEEAAKAEDNHHEALAENKESDSKLEVADSQSDHEEIPENMQEVEGYKEGQNEVTEEKNMSDEQTEETGEEQAAESEAETAMPENQFKTGTHTHLTEESVLEQAEKSNGPKKAIHEKFEGVQPSLHEKLQQSQKGKALADKFKNSPISNLSAAIGLNEKAAFIKELFKGDKQAFKETVEKLNSANNYEEALNYLDNTIKHRFDWNEESETVEKFMALVYRRFINQ